MTRLFFLLVLCVLCVMSLLAQSSQAQQVSDAGEAAAQVRAMYFMRDYEGAHIEAKKLLEQFPDAPELRAWYVFSLCGDRKAEEGLRVAEEMTTADSTEAWSLFAHAAAVSWHPDRTAEQGLEAGDKAFAAAPDHPDFVWLQAEILSRMDKKEEAIALVDEHEGRFENPVELIVTKANALASLGLGRNPDPARRDEALAAFETARALDPENVRAIYLNGSALQRAGRRGEAYPLLKEAAARSPSTGIHFTFWRCVMGLPDKSSEEKQAEIEADIEALLAQRGTSTGLLLMVSQQYEQLQLNDKKEAIEDRILEIDPYGENAEWVLVNRYRAFRNMHRETLNENDSLKAIYRSMLEAFIDRPEHRRDRLLGDAYRNLFYITQDDSTVSNEALLEIINGMIAYEGINPHTTYAGSAIALAERKAYFREAERIAREGIIEGKKKIDEQKEHGAYDTEGDYERGLNWMTGIMYDALGWVFFHEGRLEDAENELLRAYDLHHENMKNLYHLGQLYETKHAAVQTEAGQGARAESAAMLPEVVNYLEKAESFYFKGSTVQSPGENPNDEALKLLYEKQHGSLDGYDDYLATFEERDRARRKKEVMEARFEDPEPLEAFTLTVLDGDSLSTADLQGKTVAINTWGLWCGWCLEEMPDLQKLHEKYQDDADVLILTINNDPNLDEVRAWMKEQGYTFPVLIDDGYLARVGSHTFPTTWFLDRQVRKAFEKIGWSEKLIEEFSWRLDVLREE